MDQRIEDSDLIERAQNGDAEAFGELVRRHRSKAFDWARSVAGDPHLAEDIVQEALLRAFLHLGTLADMSRFLPWLHRIVRNEALMKLRRGEHSGKERTFTGLMAQKVPFADVDWADLDSILLYLSDNGKVSAEAGDPSVQLAQKEFLETIRHLLRCLTDKERAIFEAHFFRQLAPAEIARLFATSTDSVYQSISRIRQKVKEERSRERYREYIRESRETSLPERNVVDLKKGPNSANWKRCKTSFAGAVFQTLHYTRRGRKYSLTDVMGLTSQAFRLTIEAECVDASGPTMYFWEPVFRDGLLNLGLLSEHAGDGGVPPSPYMLGKGIALIRRSIAQGVPVVAWDLFSPEFGVIYGYDDREQLLYAEDARTKRTIPYEQLGKGVSGGLFALSIVGEYEIRQWEAVRNALDMAVRHAYGEMSFVGYVCGLAAYECWIEAFRRKSVQPLGNAYTARIAADARTYAGTFLNELVRKLAEADRLSAASLAKEAAKRYDAIAEALKSLSVMFPFPEGGTPGESTAAEAAIRLLERAKAEEEAAVLLLERLIGQLGLFTNLNIEEERI